MANRYDFFVQVEKLSRPLGKMKFEATVPYIVKNPGQNVEHVKPHLHIWWGETSTEAESKAKAEADEWIAQQRTSES